MYSARKFPRRSLVIRRHGHVRPWMSPPAALAQPGRLRHHRIPRDNGLHCSVLKERSPRVSLWQRGRVPPLSSAPGPRALQPRDKQCLGALLENCIVSTSVLVMCCISCSTSFRTCKVAPSRFAPAERGRSVRFQATKSQRWMPWRQMPMKDVGGCEKPRGAAYQASIRGYPNGETRLGSCPVTSA